jgi:hypothetical protein
MQDCELMSLFLFMQEESSINDDGSCSGLESAEECLIRRSMADHTDYIYTQDISGPWPFSPPLFTSGISVLISFILSFNC